VGKAAKRTRGNGSEVAAIDSGFLSPQPGTTICNKASQSKHNQPSRLFIIRACMLHEINQPAAFSLPWEVIIGKVHPDQGHPVTVMSITIRFLLSTYLA
jgi:hypothetical protein